MTPNARVIDVLCDQLRSPDDTERQIALERLTSYAPDQAPHLIVPLLEDNVDDVRATAVVCLQELRDISTLPLLLRIVEDDESERVRAYAIGALSAFTSPQVRDCLVANLSRRLLSNIGALRAVRQLWRYDDESVIKILKEVAISHPDANVRLHAADSLSFLFTVIGAPNDWESFWKGLASVPEAGVSRIAVNALQLAHR